MQFQPAYILRYKNLIFRRTLVQLYCIRINKSASAAPIVRRKPLFMIRTIFIILGMNTVYAMNIKEALSLDIYYLGSGDGSDLGKAVKHLQNFIVPSTSSSTTGILKHSKLSHTDHHQYILC